MSGQTRRRLPARVYWVRRIMVLGTALLLVVAIAKLLGGSGGGSGGDSAANVADTSSLTGAPSPSDGTTVGPSNDVSPSGGHHGRHGDEPVTRAAMPSGPCAASDVAITPSVPKPIAGSDISLVLDISSLNIPACTWTLSGTTMALKITSGADLIWTTAECAKAIPTQDLTLRQADPTKVRLTWNARRSAPGCPALTQWALPGTYHLHVAALAGQPQDLTFLLSAPSPANVTKTAHPHNGGHDGGHNGGHKKKHHQQTPPG
jgi:hypothetical protein